MTGEDPYVDTKGVLLNKLDITSSSALSQAETDLSLAAMLRLSVHPLPGSYDLGHLQSFHRQIFGAVYPWAGELRTVDIARTGQDVFCRCAFIESYSAGVFADLAAEGRLMGLRRNAFVARLAHYYGEINAIHPFREGNGRTQRAFLGQLGRDAGWRIAWSAMDGHQNDTASAAALQGDTTLLATMFESLVRPI
ncbi:Fic/DOC family protein [Paractinoplanes hotanensis]|uniref:protein adenylyltransferase n=1 Tax=Paractinoplanes hotanensis TaxID=2906497 RepID=A0ABT0YCA6_9ACTN|nr:Fic family protein [Actinoplanes hotanensis]MCM4083683.1 Fic family protein [Actinoplanes hotanensis]